MSENKLETIIYVVGPKRSWEFQLKHLKTVIGLLVALFLALGGVILFQYFMHIHEKEVLTEQLRQEQVRNDKLISRIKRAGKQDPEWEQQILSQSTQQKKLNEQQAALIAKQVRELTELRSILQQRERVVQQFQLEKKSIQEQINSLQDDARALRQQLQVSQSSLGLSKKEFEAAQSKITELETELSKAQKQAEKKKKQTASAKKQTTKKKKLSKNAKTLKPKTITSTNKTINIENLKISYESGNVKVIYKLKNITNKSASGRAGLYISSKKSLSSSVRYGKSPSIPYKIRRFRMIARDFTRVKPNAYLRLIIWDAKKNVIIDKNFQLAE